MNRSFVELHEGVRTMIGTLSFTISQSDGRTFVAVAGDIDCATAPELHAILDQYGHQSVTVDLNGVTFIDSSGLGTLISAQERITLAGGQLAIRSPRPNVQKAFEITGLTERFTGDPLPT